jgi:hypothetical protein
VPHGGYLGEVHYYSIHPPDFPSIFPSPTATTAPFYPPLPQNLVPGPYGGEFDLDALFSIGGYVATPSALVAFAASLSNAYAGSTSGPRHHEPCR